MDKASKPVRWRAIAVVALAVGGCAGTPPPTAELAVANTRIEEAERNGGVQYAPVELSEARSKLGRAQAAVREGKNEDARRLAGEAEADARLADVKARAATHAKAADAIQQDVQVLRRESQPVPIR
jgi:hypothetical protein